MKKQKLFLFTKLNILDQIFKKTALQNEKFDVYDESQFAGTIKLLCCVVGSVYILKLWWRFSIVCSQFANIQVITGKIIERFVVVSSSHFHHFLN